LVNISQCFNDTARDMNFNVGSEVTKLSDLYHFCTDVKVTAEGSPSRIVLTLDGSRSMCEEVTGCAGASRNDPTDKRISGANAFVDSIAARCPTCEVGVIVYTGGGSTSPVASSQTPLQLNATNVAALHRAINDAACGGGLAKTGELGKTAKLAKTFTGLALDAAIKMVDAGFDTLKGMDRHVILLTDGDWQTPTTQELYDAYKAAYPSRKLPVVHGVFLSDSAAHAAAGFPQYGLLTCSATDSVPMDMSFLQLAAGATGGKYFPGSTPQTIVNTFQELFKVILDTSRVGLSSVTFTNANTGELRPATFEKDTAFPLGGHFIVHVPEFDLATGSNTFIITWITQDTTGFRRTLVDTFRINRQTTVGTGATEVFKTVCGTDSVDLSITCTPPAVLVNGFDTVRAAVDPADLPAFIPNDITVRAFTPFPDEKDSRVLLLFHLDDKNLANTARGGQPGAGTGAPTIAASGAFGGCISAGTFATPSILSLSGNFTFECWIKPGAATQSASIASAAGFSFGMKDGYLTATLGAKTITTNHVVDKDVWQHAAVARTNGSTNIYVNGLPMASPTNTTETVSGSFTIGNFGGGLLDEVRLSNFARTSSIFGQILIDIPTADNLTWKIGGTTVTGTGAVLPADLWRGTPQGRLSFQLTRLAPGPVMVNFFDTIASGQLMWSKNGEPVLFAANGIPVVATLLDTSHDGHLDRVDLTWTDNITLASPLPPYTELIGTLFIITMDGKTVNLQVSAVVGDQSNKTVHVILVQTTGATMETDQQSAKVVLKDAAMTTTGEPFIVTGVVDGAGPIPTAACYAPSEKADTLKITFSENVEDDTLNPAYFMRLPGDTALSAFRPVSAGKKAEQWILVFPYNPPRHAVFAYDYRIQELFPVGPRSPAVDIDFCYPVSLIDNVRVGPNPFVDKGVVNGPTVTYPDGRAPEQIKGQKIEIKLKRPVVGTSGKQEIQAWLTIFDAVGNVLLQDRPLGMENPTTLSMGWDGTNLNKMKVAGGTYLGRYVVKHIVGGETKKEETGKVKLARKTVK
jgi:hypothetical protein